MDNTGKMYSQVAAAAKVTEQQASVACYLLNLSRSGKRLDDAAALLRMERPEVRDHARSWAIPFEDYQPNSNPLTLTWEKPKRGLWELKHDGAVIAVAQSDGEGGYSAAIGGGIRQSFDGSSASVAIKHCSRALERLSLTVLGVDDVVIIGPSPIGELVTVAPTDIGDRATLARALHS